MFFIDKVGEGALELFLQQFTQPRLEEIPFVDPFFEGETHSWSQTRNAVKQTFVFKPLIPHTALSIWIAHETVQFSFDFCGGIARRNQCRCDGSG